MVERWQVYVHDLGTVATGAAGRLTDVPLQLDMDAAFVLRARSFAVLQTTGETAVSFSAVQSVSSRFRDPNYGYRSVDLIPSSFDPSPLATDGPVPYPVYPNLIYPPGSSINTDFQNNGAHAAHFYIVYHGVKLFGTAEQAYTYPPACRMMDFSYTLSIPNLAVGETRTDNIKTIRQDADFALGAAYVCTKQQPGQAAQGSFTNLFVKVLDHHRREFSNDWVPCNSIFGNAAVVSPFRNAIPGLIVPEWYIPANDWFELQFKRVDAAISGAHTVDLQCVFRGRKVYRG